MNNLTDAHFDEETKTLDLTQNEKEEITIDIERTSDDLSNNKEIVNQINYEEEINIADQTNVHIENEFRERSEQKDEKFNTLTKVGAEKRPPEIWVQYNQAYGQGQGYGQGQDNVQVRGFGRTPHYNDGGGHYYGGAPLDYDPQSRNYFVKFVFVILFVMLAITAAIGTFINASSGLKEYYQDNSLMLMILSMIVLVGMNYVMACSPCSRVPPCNFISLVVVVLAMSNLVGTITVRYETNVLILAIIATLVTVAVCILLACSRFDFTKWYLYVVVVTVVFAAISMILGITMLVMQIRYKPLHIGMLFIGAIINVVILIMELQMILGGRAIELGEDDYALAAYLLYTSIVDIFLKLVQILGIFDE